MCLPERETLLHKWGEGGGKTSGGNALERALGKRGYMQTALVHTVAAGDTRSSTIRATIARIEKDTLYKANRKWKEIHPQKEIAGYFVAKCDVSEVPLEELHSGLHVFEKCLVGYGYGIYSIDYTQDFSGVLDRKALVDNLGFRKARDFCTAIDEKEPTILSDNRLLSYASDNRLDNRLLSYAFSRRRCFATDFSHRRPMLRKVCFVAVFAVSALPQVCFAASSSAAVSALPKVCFAASALPKVCFAVSSSAPAAASSLSKVSFVAVFVASSSAVASLSAAVSSLPTVCFAVSSSAVASSLSKVCFVAVFAGPLSAAASSSSTASAASLALWKNRATTLAGWRTISLSKSTSFSCKTMFLFFVSIV